MSHITSERNFMLRCVKYCCGFKGQILDKLRIRPKYILQRGFEIQTCRDFERSICVWFLNGSFSLDLFFNINDKLYIKLLRLNPPFFSGFWNPITFEIRSSKSLNLKIWNVSGFEMVRFQIPTVINVKAMKPCVLWRS